MEIPEIPEIFCRSRRSLSRFEEIFKAWSRPRSRFINILQDFGNFSFQNLSKIFPKSLPEGFSKDSEPAGSPNALFLLITIDVHDFLLNPPDLVPKLDFLHFLTRVGPKSENASFWHSDELPYAINSTLDFSESDCCLEFRI